MKIKIISIGKFGQSKIKSEFDKYCDRLNYKILLIEINSKKLSTSNIDLIKKHEAALITKHFSNNSYKIALDEKGCQFNSKQFAQIMVNCNPYNEVIFIIGGAHGLDSDVINKVDKIISLSKLTFPHIMVRLILIEQIYRSYTILNNHPYHKI